VELLRQVGEGGMGVVWAARHEVLARDVAVKFLLAPGTTEGDVAAAEMFVQGARAAAAVRHPGLTAVHDAGVVGAAGGVGGVPYVVMEFVDGPTLADVLQRGPMTLPAVRTVLARVCDAVEELHKHELVHRDIKPSNIMINRCGEVMVTDFGLACPRGVRSEGIEGEPRGIAGTPAYMAPEMFKGEVTAKSDVYAIGATAFELLAGSTPYRGDLSELRAAAAKGDVPRKRLLERGVPEDVVRGIERCMNKEAAYRPKSATRVGEMFERAFAELNPVVHAATAEEIKVLAFPVAREAVTDDAEAPPALPVAGTMFGLVSEIAERKRKSGGVTAADGNWGGEAEGPASPPIAMVHAHATCKSCGYSLEGISGKRCPECGSLIVLSSSDSALKRRNPARQGVNHGPHPRLKVASLAASVSVGVLLASGLLAVPYKTVSPAFAVSALAAVAMYRRMGFRSWGGSSGAMCGWCAHSLRDGRFSACPGCGHSPREGITDDDLPPARAKGVLRHTFSMTAASLVGMAGLAAVVLYSWERAPWDWHSLELPDVPVLGVRLSWLFMLGLIAIVSMITVIAFYYSARGTILLDGVARCGRCGAKGETLRRGRCLVCDPDGPQQSLM
jgi:hypothetical protein